LNLHIFRRLSEAPAGEMASLVGESNLQIDRADRVLQELAEYAELEEPKSEVCDVNDVVEAVTALIRREAAKKNVEISVVTPTQPARVYMDPSSLRQILLCLLNNAHEAVAERGQIAVRVAASKKNVEIVVADNGPGIPATLRDRIFEPFFTTKENSCGAGLAVLRRQVIQADGCVEYEPNEPRGSRFRITFPAHDSRPAGPAAASSKNHRL
jgi:signal transduction histidine kinase